MFCNVNFLAYLPLFAGLPEKQCCGDAYFTNFLSYAQHVLQGLFPGIHHFSTAVVMHASLALLCMQGMFFNAYFLAYIISPKSCHSFVGYLEEEAVKTYTHAIHDLDRQAA